MHPRPSLSRVEVVVVLLIAVLVVGMVLAATGRLRDTADRVTCQHNLKQLGIAVHNLYSQNSALLPLADQGDGSSCRWPRSMS